MLRDFFSKTYLVVYTTLFWHYLIGLPPKERENGEGRSGKILLLPVDDL